MRRLPDRVMAALLVLSGLALFTASLRAQSTFVYVNNSPNFPGANSVSGFSADDNGALTAIGAFPTLGNGNGVGFIASNRITTTGNFLYASNDGSNNISGFSIDTSTGALTLVPGSPFAIGGGGSQGISLAATPNGQFLYAAAALGNFISAFEIEANGALTLVAGFPIAAGGSPDGIEVSPDGKFLAVTLPGTGVAMFSIASDGTLTLVTGSPFPAGPAAVSVDINCASSLLFAANGSTTSTTVSAFTIGPDGVLSAVAGSPFNFTGGINSGVNVLSPDDQHLFVSNQDSNTITALNVASTGNLAQVTGSPFAIPLAGHQPFSMATNQAGTLLYVLDSPTTVPGKEVVAFNIASSGALSPVPGSGSSPELGRAGLTVFPPKACASFAPLPTITSISPSSGTQGQTISNFTVNGTNFQLASTLSFKGSPADISVTYVSRTATQIVASIIIAPGAAPGARDVIITNPDGQMVSFRDAFQVLPSCSVSSINLDKSFSNGVISGSVSGSTCEVTITLQNLKNFWTNFTISTVRSVTVTPLGEDQNLYAKFGLLPPSSFLPLPPGKSVSFVVRFSKPGEAVSVFSNPTMDTGIAAGVMNIVQAILNLLPLGSAPVLVIDDYQKIAELLPKIPDLQAAISNLFRNSPDTAKAAKDILRFFNNNDELIKFAFLASELGFNTGSEVIKGLFEFPFRIVNSLVAIFGNLRTAFFQFPAGSISFVAR